MQANLAKQSRNLQKQLKEKNTEVSELESKLDDMSSTLANAQSEIKALQTKLAAARNAAANAENGQSKPGRGATARSNGNGGSDPHATQTAQLKEDLYSDLTGLIIRDAKKKGEEDVYDCIQTGLNGSMSQTLCSSPFDHSLTITLQLSILSSRYPILSTKDSMQPSSNTHLFLIRTVTGTSSTFFQITLLWILPFHGRMQPNSTAGLSTRLRRKGRVNLSAASSWMHYLR